MMDSRFEKRIDLTDEEFNALNELFGGIIKSAYAYNSIHSRDSISIKTDDVSLPTGGALVIEFTNGSIVDISTSEWGSIMKGTLV